MHGNQNRPTYVQISVMLGAVLLLAMSTLVAAPAANAATWPGSTNTGVPSTTTLKKYVGNMVITTPGKVLDGYDVYGTVTVRSANVTITRSRIRGNTSTVSQDLLRASDPAATGLKVTDTTIKPDSPTRYHAIGIRLGAKNQLVQRVNLSGTVDGVRISGSTVRVESSYLHDFRHYSDPVFTDGTHDDAVQIQGGTTIRIIGNTFGGAYNAGVMLNQDLATISDVWVNSNLADGGGCTINITKGSRGYLSGLQVNSNRFGDNQRISKCAITYRTSETSLKPSGNVWDSTGSAVKPNAY